ncbi:flocculation protein FLO11-like [Archocentrus centrarchus]|uniref:flocculation protein FLO11-like n=1 Tax=Archocentrus centrarchus TaxID=63155 RepID=UPI0011EA02E7|nr:flocculation protein FLO11-like [Archocentrus centrarchus]
MSQISAKPRKSRQSHLDLLALSFEDTEVPCASYVEALSENYWRALADGASESEVDVLLAEMCRWLLGHVTTSILDKIEPRVTAHRHKRVPKVTARTSTNLIISDSLLSWCRYCRVTEDDVEACFGDILDDCFYQLLAVVQIPSYDSARLRSLLSTEVAKRVNLVMSYRTGSHSVKSHSLMMEMNNNIINIVKMCKKPLSPQHPAKNNMNIYDIMLNLPKLDEDDSLLQESAETSAETSTETSSETSTETSSGTSSETSSGTSAENSAEPKGENSAETSSETSSETSAEPSAKNSAEPKGENSAETSAENSAEPKGENSAETSAKNSAEPKGENSAEPSAEPSTETSSETSSETSTETSTETSSETSSGTSAENSAEPKGENSAETSSETSAEPSAKNSAEPKGENSAETSAETSAENSAEPSAENSAEPKGENSAETSSEPSTETSAENSAVTGAESAESQTLLLEFDNFLTLFLATLVGYIAKKTQTSVGNIDLLKRIGRIQLQGTQPERPKPVYKLTL